MWITWSSLSLWSFEVIITCATHICKCLNTLLFSLVFFLLPCYLSFSLSTMFSIMLPLVFFFQLSVSLNSWWFNFSSTISRTRTWVIKSQFYKASQPSMHANDIQLIDRQRVFGYSSSRPLFFFFFQIVYVVLQPS